MKTAEEVAEEICSLIIHNWKPQPEDERVGQIAQALAAYRASANELFILNVDCELGSGCPKNNTCSGACHWQTAAQIRAEALEEAAKIAYERMKARDAMNQHCCGSAAEFIGKDIRALKDKR